MEESIVVFSEQLEIIEGEFLAIFQRDDSRTPTPPLEIRGLLQNVSDYIQLGRLSLKLKHVLML